MAAATRSARDCWPSSARERIRDTPLSESGFTGAGIGAAMAGHASDRRADDGEFQPARARPDSQQRRHHPPHVGKSVRRAARHPHGDRRRPASRRPAFAQPRRLVRPHPGHQGAGAGDARGCARHAVDGAAGSGPGADLRERDALQPDRQARGRRRSRSTSTRPLCAAPGRDISLITYGGSLWKTLEAANSARRREHRCRGHRFAQPAAARR